ncbi:hypothetical protein EYF80_037260 [Liparis tanakae]|uniref:Uncharacterized protein n=1 Tax=Liparis tanakae TaxID=230148 RepID=A0A4Z2GHV7_9TELE|nr:hypothetical protein EYF80_037260 [Liparis tanakae]
MQKEYVSLFVLEGRQADGLLEEAELGVVEPERLVDHVGRRLHVHLADGHRLAVFCHERDLWREVSFENNSPESILMMMELGVYWNLEVGFHPTTESPPELLHVL